ncbi:DUF6483 family protein [Ruminococcus sp.]|jgi:hypothetical protein|uniref:DUF6483 family protein n=1 Tax=Ruminococcus sp. TaxID=41978 RepID=UPI0025F141DE|nr:DUF6483 family protein [Ruminococcus sp.]
MFEQDYIMRQIKEMTAIMAKIMFGVNDRKSFYMLQEVERQKVHALVTQVKNGEPKEAVLELDRLTDNNTKENMMIGLEFYAQLSDMDEEYFINSGYSFGNMRDDFEHFAKKFGMEQMTELYFGKDENNE